MSVPALLRRTGEANAFAHVYSRQNAELCFGKDAVAEALETGLLARKGRLPARLELTDAGARRLRSLTFLGAIASAARHDHQGKISR